MQDSWPDIFQTLHKTGTVGMVVQMPLHTVCTQEREVILQLSRAYNIPWRCFGGYSMWCNTGAPPNKEGMMRRPPRRSGTTQQGEDRPIPPGGSFLLIGSLTREGGSTMREGDVVQPQVTFL